MTLITLAVDDHPRTSAAIRWVAERAARDGSTVNIVSVCHDSAAGRAAAEGAVTDAAARIARLQPSLVCATSIAVGDVVDELVLVSGDSDLLVVGSDRPSPVEGLLHATLPMRLAGRTHCDLVVVPAGWIRSDGGAIVVGWSPESAGATALERGAREAIAGKARLTIVHAWMPVTGPAYRDASGAVVAALREDAELTLREATERARHDHPQLEVTSELHLGSVVGGLSRHHPRMIVVGGHEHSAAGQILLDPYGDALIREVTDVPILITAGARGVPDRVPEVSHHA
jgi:nucleotide-binding universal stress UspA family protein